uniref:Major facilitator superfamily (MFS) profile domain-containing protein n=1 Tax=Kwoniella dejecticola CBS 10117 TaxID=1296121 RepID=A0A1A6A8B0_9TREE|nr:uncharacterized protein I303_04014 [Kwoniella dejecticola CBS 10117]OBR86292.1 hypothetical protein I303_04014 [Kwoniella dejecticola CBS 10117]
MAVCGDIDTDARCSKNRIGLRVFRAVSGLGLSISAPAGFGIIGTTFRTEPWRTTAFAALGMGTPLGAVLGEVLGGVIAGTGSKGWQYLYFLLAGFGVIPIITGFFFIPKDDNHFPTLNAHRRIDWIGAVLVTIGLSLLLFSITQAGLMEKGWTTPYIPPIFSASIILILIFGWWEYELENRPFRTNDIPPIVRLSIFTRHKGKISAILGIAFFDWMGVCGWVYLTSVYYQDLLGFSPLKNALHILPAPITGIICSYLVTLVVPRVSAPILLALGGISTGLANALFAFQTPGSIMISNLVDDDEQSIAGALFQVSLQIAGSLDPCISSIILTQIESVHGLLRGLQIALWFNAACCWAVLLIIFFAFRKVRLAKDVAKTI